MSLNIDISIILVNYNTTKLTLDCIRSINSGKGNLRVEIIVVDNASSSDPANEFLKEDAELIYLRNNTNVGFARGCNIGMKHARGNHLLLLNTDTVLLPDTLERCHRFMNEPGNDSTGVMGVKLLNPDLSIQYSYFWSANSFGKIIQENVLYTYLFKNRISKRGRLKQELLHLGISNPPWLAGTFMWMKRDVVEKNSLYFDEDFFMYSEDVELCHRIRSYGLSVVYYPEASVIHLGGGGDFVPLRRRDQLQLSEWLCILKTKGKLKLRLYLWMQLFNRFSFRVLLLRKRPSFAILRQALLYRRQSELCKQYRTFIFSNFEVKPSSSGGCLKYDAQKTA